MRDETEFVAFATARRAQLRRTAYALCGDWHQAEDLVQTALAKLYVAWPRVTGSEEAYARRVILNAVVDESRRPWRRRETVVAEHDDHPQGAPAEPVRDDVVAALQALPAMQRTVVVLRHWLDLSVEQTAHELGISPGTVKSHTSRALAHLHTALADPAVADRTGDLR